MRSNQSRSFMHWRHSLRTYLGFSTLLKGTCVMQGSAIEPLGNKTVAVCDLHFMEMCARTWAELFYLHLLKPPSPGCFTFRPSDIRNNTKPQTVSSLLLLEINRHRLMVPGSDKEEWKQQMTDNGRRELEGGAGVKGGDSVGGNMQRWVHLLDAWC